MKNDDLEDEYWKYWDSRCSYRAKIEGEKRHKIERFGKILSLIIVILGLLVWFFLLGKAVFELGK